MIKTVLIASNPVLHLAESLSHCLSLMQGVDSNHWLQSCGKMTRGRSPSGPSIKNRVTFFLQFSPKESSPTRAPGASSSESIDSDNEYLRTPLIFLCPHNNLIISNVVLLKVSAMCLWPLAHVWEYFMCEWIPCIFLK